VATNIHSDIVCRKHTYVRIGEVRVTVAALDSMLLDAERGQRYICARLAADLLDGAGTKDVQALAMWLHSGPSRGRRRGARVRDGIRRAALRCWPPARGKTRVWRMVDGIWARRQPATRFGARQTVRYYTSHQAALGGDSGADYGAPVPAPRAGALRR
jgi:hypothetical protein